MNPVARLHAINWLSDSVSAQQCGLPASERCGYIGGTEFHVNSRNTRRFRDFGLKQCEQFAPRHNHQHEGRNCEYGKTSHNDIDRALD